jgi:hypothetical protein
MSTYVNSFFRESAKMGIDALIITISRKSPSARRSQAGRRGNLKTSREVRQK